MRCSLFPRLREFSVSTGGRPGSAAGNWEANGALHAPGVAGKACRAGAGARGGLPGTVAGSLGVGGGGGDAKRPVRAGKVPSLRGL